MNLPIIDALCLPWSVDVSFPIDKRNSSVLPVGSICHFKDETLLLTYLIILKSVLRLCNCPESSFLNVGLYS